MFSIINKTEGGFDKVILKDDESGTFAEIIPSCGAILHAFTAINDGKEINVVESYDNAEDFKKHVTLKGFLGTKLSPFVCRLNKGKYNFEGREFKIEKYYLGDNALHGLLYDQPYRIIGRKENENEASVSMLHEYRAMDHGYPFNYDCVVTYELEKHNRLNVFTQVVNKDNTAIPIQDGWHPYFTLDAGINDLKLQFRSFEMVEFDKDLIPAGKLIPYKEFDTLKQLGDTFLDNCFTLNFSEGQPICLLQNTEKNIELEIHADESYPYLQIYTPTHRNSIAIENISSVPDAFNNGIGLKTLSPGESATFKCSYKISLLT